MMPSDPSINNPSEVFQEFLHHDPVSIAGAMNIFEWSFKESERILTQFTKDGYLSRANLIEFYVTDKAIEKYSLDTDAALSRSIPRSRCHHPKKGRKYIVDETGIDRGWECSECGATSLDPGWMIELSPTGTRTAIPLEGFNVIYNLLV